MASAAAAGPHAPQNLLFFFKLSPVLAPVHVPVHGIHGSPRAPEAAPTAVLVVLQDVGVGLDALDHLGKLPHGFGLRSPTDRRDCKRNTQSESAHAPTHGRTSHAHARMYIPASSSRTPVTFMTAGKSRHSCCYLHRLQDKAELELLLL